MELRLLQSEAEREQFEQGMTQARAARADGFVEKQASLVGRLHLAFGDLWALFDETSSTPDRMLAGFAMHRLDRFGQSHCKPDLTCLPPADVVEVGEVWSVHPGAGPLAVQAATIAVELAGATTALSYLICAPVDTTGRYRYHRAIGGPIEWPYVETLTGEPVHVQPMVLDGVNLQRLTAVARRTGFEVAEGNKCIRYVGQGDSSQAGHALALMSAATTQAVMAPKQPAATIQQPVQRRTAVREQLAAIV